MSRTVDNLERRVKAYYDEQSLDAGQLEGLRAIISEQCGDPQSNGRRLGWIPRDRIRTLGPGRVTRHASDRGTRRPTGLAAAAMVVVAVCGFAVYLASRHELPATS